MFPFTNTSQIYRDFRKNMPICDNWAYFDHAAVGPLSGPGLHAVKKWLGEAAAAGDTVWPQWKASVERCRAAGARLIGAKPQNVTLVPNTTWGISLVAEGLDWRAGDNVVFPADEFPSNQYAFLNLTARGVETRRVEMPPGTLDLAKLLAAVDSKTRLVSLSWVGYAHGWRTDVAAAVEQIHVRGALVFLDAIQGLGVFPLDVAQIPVDALAADGHKWLLGPEGAGYCYLSDNLLDQLRPIGVGWNSVVQGNDFTRINPEWLPTAARYEGGSLNMAGFLGLGASVELLLEIGIDNIAQRVLDYTDELVERLRQSGAVICSVREQREHASGIVSFEIPSCDPMQVRAACLSAGVALSTRAGKLRASPHAYNDESDLEKLLSGLEFARRQG
ncbi:MAG: aminotransferase class V-fold PLP-dependent enzyme [Pirellulales bacterium]|nr:aminotransferase class V-fold PLP-dependent enzyme [Pirellulales bacterium]